MKKSIFLSILTVILFGLSSFVASDFVTEKKLESQNYELILGEFTLEKLKSTVNKNWYNKEYKAYSPKPEIIKKMTSVLNKNDLNITVYMGTWCEDSQYQFPHLIKILNQAKFDLVNLKIIGVDQDKVVPNINDKEREKLNIINVPTIIVFNKEKKEMNRFVEFAQESLEEDLLKIVSGKEYKNVYDF